MTEPVILLGTQSNGETLPVQVNEFGQLVAEGLQGPEGEQGPPGEPGPPGSIDLPPDPFEGAILGWQNNQLAWLGASIELPADTYGPFTYANGILEVPQNLDLPYGTQLYMSTETGELTSYLPVSDIIENVNTVSETEIILTFASSKDLKYFDIGDVVQKVGEVWSDYGGTNTYEGDGGRYDRRKAFNGLTSGFAECTLGPNGGDTYWNWEYPSGIPFNKLEIRGSAGQSLSSHALLINDERATNLGSALLSVPDINTFTPKFNSPIGDRLYKISVLAWTQGIALNGVYIDGEQLVDTDGSQDARVISKADNTITVSGGQWQGRDGTGSSSGDTAIVGQVKSGAGSVSVTANNAIALREDNGEWVDGFYVSLNTQKIASRRLLGMTMGIDDLRQKRD